MTTQLLLLSSVAFAGDQPASCKLEERIRAFIGQHRVGHFQVACRILNGDRAQAKLVTTVNAVYAQYREEIERQHTAIEQRVDIQIDAPQPEARLQFADAGLELLVRYPVEIRRAPDIDQEMTRRVLQLIETDETLRTAVSGTPKIRSAIKG